MVTILTTIARDHENHLKGISEEEDEGSVGSNSSVHNDELFRNDFSADDRWFILCSRPNGNVSLIPTLFSIVGFVCSVLGNNICSLFYRKLLEDGDLYFTSNLKPGLVENIAGVSLGLYAYGVKYYHGGVDDYIVTCSPNMPMDIENDIYIKVARGFSALAAIIGLPVMCVLAVANCMMLRRKTFRRITVTLFFVTCSQCMIFIYLLSERCHENLFPEFPDVNLKPCSLNYGSKLSISACVFWFLAAVFTAYIERASMVEDHLKMLSMHVMALSRG